MSKKNRRFELTIEMQNNKISIQKIYGGIKMNTNMFCSFYVSEAHLVTMLLPYMKQKMEEEYDVYPFFEKDLNNIAHRIIDSITSVEEKTNLRKIEWKNNKIKLNKKRKKLIVIMGTEEYIKKKKKEIGRAHV